MRLPRPPDADISTFSCASAKYADRALWLIDRNYRDRVFNQTATCVDIASPPADAQFSGLLCRRHLPLDILQDLYHWRCRLLQLLATIVRI
jgi:hypothetical protein